MAGAKIVTIDWSEFEESGYDNQRLGATGKSSRFLQAILSTEILSYFSEKFTAGERAKLNFIFS